jgi:hypothetical protein
MIYSDDWAEEIQQHRLDAIRHTIHPVTVEELGKLGEQRFEVATDPWYERYQEFLKDHPTSSYYMARFFEPEAEEHVELIYCKESNRGIWFLPGKGMGVVQPDELAELEKIVGEL